MGSMSGTSSNIAQWAGHYLHEPGPGTSIGRDADPTVVTMGATSIPTSAALGGSPIRPKPGIEGRVGKPARRRPRASRRAPVTLLNTDTTNFRAMVQQFTGIPSGPYGGPAEVPLINFTAADYMMPPMRPSPPAAAIMSFDHLHLLRPQQQPQYNETNVGYSSNVQGGSSGHGDVFVHGFEPAEDHRMFLQSLQTAQMLPRPDSTRDTNGYFG